MRGITIMAGKVGYELIDWAIQTKGFNLPPVCHQTFFKKVAGIIQINYPTKHSIFNIVSNLYDIRPILKIRKGTEILLETTNYKDAILYIDKISKNK